MKKNALSAIILSFAVLILIQTATAQSVKKFTAEIPFKFSIGGKTFEAGKYTLSILNVVHDSHSFQLIDENNRVQALFNTRSKFVNFNERNSKVAIKFRRYGEQYFLAEISDPSNSFSVEVKKSKEEILIAKSFNGKKTETASLILSK